MCVVYKASLAYRKPFLFPADATSEYILWLVIFATFSFLNTFFFVEKSCAVNNTLYSALPFPEFPELLLSSLLHVSTKH